jgi:hypothetical protein
VVPRPLNRHPHALVGRRRLERLIDQLGSPLAEQGLQRLDLARRHWAQAQLLVTDDRRPGGRSWLNALLGRPSNHGATALLGLARVAPQLNGLGKTPYRLVFLPTYAGVGGWGGFFNLSLFP